MKFFIDTANLKQIKEAQALGILDGVTTNPSLMARERINDDIKIKQHYIDICNIVDGDVSVEVIATDFEGIIKEGEELAKLHSQIVVKVLSADQRIDCDPCLSSTFSSRSRALRQESLGYSPA